MHLYLEKTALSVCPKCGRAVLPHKLCNWCGYYKGREMIDVMAKLTKKEKKAKEKEMAEKEKEKPLGAEALSQKQ